MEVSIIIPCFNEELVIRDTLEHLIKVRQWCGEVGIGVQAFFILGFPWETEKHAEDIKSYLKRLRPDFMRVTALMIVKGSEISKTVKGSYDKGFYDGKSCSKDVKRLERWFYFNPFRVLRMMKVLGFKNMFWMAWWGFVKK